MKTLPLVCAAAATLLAGPAAGAPIAFDYRVQVTSLGDPGGLLAGSGLGLGSIVDVQYAVESTTADIDPTPEVGYFDGGLSTVTLQLGAQPLVIDSGSATTNGFFVLDDFLLSGSPLDQYSALVDSGSATLDGTPITLDVFVVSLGSSITSLFSSDSMLGAQPGNPVSDWDRLNFLQVQGTLGADTFLIDAVVIATPEPGSGALLGLGLLGLTLRSRRVQSSSGSAAR